LATKPRPQKLANLIDHPTATSPSHAQQHLSSEHRNKIRLYTSHTWVR